MAQVTIYLEDKLVGKMRTQAHLASVSQSKWISHLIEEKIGDQWPLAVREAAGRWGHFPKAEEIRRSLGKDVPREPL
jgi:hypothetical protein